MHDHDSPSSGFVEVQEEKQLRLSSSEDDFDRNVSLGFMKSPTKSTSSEKCPTKPITRMAAVKRLRFLTNDDSNKEDQQIDFQQIVTRVKELNANVLKIHNEQIQTTITMERQNKFLKVLYTNQEKIS